MAFRHSHITYMIPVQSKTYFRVSVTDHQKCPYFGFGDLHQNEFNLSPSDKPPYTILVTLLVIVENFSNLWPQFSRV